MQIIYSLPWNTLHHTSSWYDLLSTVGSRDGVLFGWRLLGGVGFVATTKDARGVESPHCEYQDV